MSVPHGDRSGAVLEPFLTDQWYVDAKTLAQPAIAAVRERKTVFVPAQWEATYFNWMENIQPWCISRQIWWGHQIPAWYGPGRTRSSSPRQKTMTRLPMRSRITSRSKRSTRSKQQASDIADDRDRDETRSIVARSAMICISATRTCSTPGSPRRCGRSRRWLAGRDAGAQALLSDQTLVTGFDIIFFWVARMMMMGLHFMKEVPFHDVYIHAPGARRHRRQDVEVEGQRHRSAWN